MAFRQLTPAAQSSFAAILARHPRFAEDFARYMPPGVADGDESTRNEWLFQQAAIWPDMVRGLPEDLKRLYNHPTWHYIDIPSFLTDEDRAALEKKLTINMSLDAPEVAQQDMNAVQTIRLARRSLTTGTEDQGETAVWLCWLLHDLGDLHQPLHSTAIFSAKLFPEGDKGGNSVLTQQGFNLHALWDEFLGDWATFAMARDRATELAGRDDLAKLGRDAAAQLDENIWLDESWQLAQTVVYCPEVLGYLRIQATRNDGQPPSPLRLSEDYLTDGVRVATTRVTQAGFRLGAVLQEIAERRE
jgi:S1/P1 Nuclease